jgi:DNA-binding MarR family transcriptional regulator
MKETRDIMDSIRKVVRAIRLSSVASERALGLSGAQLYVLQKLAEGDQASLGELAKRTLTDQSSVSVVVSKLATAGLVTKRTSPSDRRSVRISLSARGARLLASGREPFQMRLIGAIEKLTVSRRRSLASCLREVLTTAGLGGEPAPLFFEE